MIVRLIAIDPRPDKNRASDVLAYQLPENSRELKLLQEVFSDAGIEWEIVLSEKRRR